MINSLALNSLIYESESLLERMLDSTLPYVNEAYITDSGSTDSTMDILAKYKKKYPYMHYRQRDIQKLPGEVWKGGSRDRALVILLNEMKEMTKSKWILKTDDDEIWPKEVFDEIYSLEPKSHFYAVNFLHVEDGHIIDPEKHPNMGVVRLYKNIPEITWRGSYGTAAVAVNGRVTPIRKCSKLNTPFLHLGEYRKGKWAHAYRFHEKGHCEAPIPLEYIDYVKDII